MKLQTSLIILVLFSKCGARKKSNFHLNKNISSTDTSGIKISIELVDFKEGSFEEIDQLEVQINPKPEAEQKEESNLYQPVQQKRVICNYLRPSSVEIGEVYYGVDYSKIKSDENAQTILDKSKNLLEVTRDDINNAKNQVRSNINRDNINIYCIFVLHKEKNQIGIFITDTTPTDPITYRGFVNMEGKNIDKPQRFVYNESFAFPAPKKALQEGIYQKYPPFQSFDEGQAKPAIVEIPIGVVFDFASYYSAGCTTLKPSLKRTKGNSVVDLNEITKCLVRFQAGMAELSNLVLRKQLSLKVKFEVLFLPNFYSPTLPEKQIGLSLIEDLLSPQTLIYFEILEKGTNGLYFERKLQSFTHLSPFFDPEERLVVSGFKESGLEVLDMLKAWNMFTERQKPLLQFKNKVVTWFFVSGAFLDLEGCKGFAYAEELGSLGDDMSKEGNILLSMSPEDPFASGINWLHEFGHGNLKLPHTFEADMARCRRLCTTSTKVTGPDSGDAGIMGYGLEPMMGIFKGIPMYVLGYEQILYSNGYDPQQASTCLKTINQCLPTILQDTTDHDRHYANIALRGRTKLIQRAVQISTQSPVGLKEQTIKKHTAIDKKDEKSFS